MISLDEHNERHMNMSVFGQAVKNNIACPECGKEMFDTNPHVCLTSYPPKYAVHCECGYNGYRL